MPSKAPAFRPPGRAAAPALDVLREETDRRRGSSTRRGYDYQWQKLRAQKLAADPLCECDECRAGVLRTIAASVVDHIEAIEDRPDLRLEWSNLRSMAKVCHDKHTGRTRGFGRARRGAGK